MNLTEEEKKIISQYEKVPTKPMQRIGIWAVELVPPAIMIFIGFYRDKKIYLIAAIGTLVFFNVYRLFRQEKTVRILKSACSKIMASLGEKNT